MRKLPRRTARWLQELGYDALHTLDLPEGNATRDTAGSADFIVLFRR